MIVFPNLPFYFETLSTGERGRIFRIKRKWSTIFFALGKKMKPSGFASRTAGALHGTQCRFIRRLSPPKPCAKEEGVLHKIQLRLFRLSTA